MKQAQLLLLVALAAVIILAGAFLQTKPAAPENGLVRACSSAVYPADFFECGTNDLGAKYLADPSKRALDAPRVYFDAAGNELAACGGGPLPPGEPVPAACDGLEKLEFENQCKRPVTCTIDCELADNPDSCYFRQVDRTGNNSNCDLINDTSYRQICHNAFG